MNVLKKWVCLLVFVPTLCFASITTLQASVIDEVSQTQSLRTDTSKNTIVHRKVWVPAVYEKRYLSNKHPIDEFWVGMHFSAVGSPFLDTMAHAGFNIQFMSGDRYKRNLQTGIYLGFDFGVQFMGRSSNSNVVLSTLNRDTGFTRLSTRSYDFLFRAHIEQTGRDLVPYLTFHAGPRVFATGQFVKSYLPMVEYNSSSYTNAHVSADMAYGGGVGLRWQLGNTVSLDARYELNGSLSSQTVDLNESTFSGLSHNIVLKPAEALQGFLKFGFIFNLSTPRYDKRLISPGYYRHVVYDSLVRSSSDAQVVFLPCLEGDQCDCENRRLEILREPQPEFESHRSPTRTTRDRTRRPAPQIEPRPQAEP